MRNTLTVLDAAGRGDVPVAPGPTRPLLEEPVDARHVHGEDGMGDLDWPTVDPRARPAPRGRAAARRAPRGAAAATSRVTLVPLAPMTNIALLLRTYPAASPRDPRGSCSWVARPHVGNATASAEFNVFHDPEAAAIVLDACADLGIERDDVRARRLLRPARRRSRSRATSRGSHDHRAGRARRAG